MTTPSTSPQVSWRLTAESALGTAPLSAPKILADEAGLRIVEEPFLKITSVRASKQNQGIDSASWLVPSTLLPNTFEGTRSQSVARFEPRAWMMIGERDDKPSALIGGCLVTDLSCRLAAFRITGPAAAGLLASSTSVRLRPGGFARTLFAESYAVLLQCFAETDFRLLVDVSLARACADWLRDAATLAPAC